MSKIEWQLDDDWENDLVDLLGQVVLTGFDGRKLSEPCTNIDVFLAGLATIAMQLRNSDVAHAEVDLVVEPEPLTGQLNDKNQIELSYGDQAIWFENVALFEVEACRAISDFIGVMPKEVDFSIPTFVTMREFLRI